MISFLKYFALLPLLLWGCDQKLQNNPYPPSDGTENVLYSAFTSRPKHLDPAKSYSEDEAIFICQIYEPPLQYAYLTRPYEVIPLTATKMPEVYYVNEAGEKVISDSSDLAYTVYRIQIKPGIFYQMHPAFAFCQEKGDFCYHTVTEKEMRSKNTISDFPLQDTRELIAEDYVYQIKRLADPTVSSPIYGLMEDYIVGLKALNQALKSDQGKLGSQSNYFDLRNYALKGARVVDRYTYEVLIQGNYPQFIYWLTMPFFSPMPWEATRFYSQPLLIKNNITLDWYPIGTGPFILTENNPNWRMVLTKNPDFHGERYPQTGGQGDKEQGLLTKAGELLPFLDKIIFHLEKESIPYWNKFLQGYYDQSAVSTDNFDQALKVRGVDNIELTDEMQNKGIDLSVAIKPSVFYWGFNMLDSTVGGYGEKQRKLRQAISVAIDTEEYINIFLNGQGVTAMSPLPPGFIGSDPNKMQTNPVIYEVKADNAMQRKSLEYAKKLLKEAGFPNGINPKTKLPLTLYYDATITGGGDDKAEFSWLRKQFQKLGITLIVRATQYNRFQDKMRNGDFQIYRWGWNADYPDPENFFFLLYGEDSKVKSGGENASNYENTQFDALFDQMKGMPNSPLRERVIDQMISILQKDAPWVWGVHPQVFVLRHVWVAPYKNHAIARNTLKYMSIEPQLRARKWKAWNTPIRWPMGLLFTVLIIFCIPAGIHYYRRMHQPYRQRLRRKLKNE